MSGKFEATTITQTGTRKGFLDITLADAEGRKTTVSLPEDVARGLADVMGAFATERSIPAPSMAKRPKEFAVGTGQYDSVVLVRFDDDIPYGLRKDTAIELANAIIEGAELIERQPPRRLQ